MSEYIKNLTDNLIGQNNFNNLYSIMNMNMSGEVQRKEFFIKYVQLDLMEGNVRKMTPETLGKIMGSFEHGDVMISSKEIFEQVTFSGEPEELLRDIVALFLAYVINDRLSPSPRTLSSIRGW